MSNDGVNFVNFSGIPWMNKSSNSVAPYSASFAGGNQNSSGSFGTDGYIVPEDTNQAQTYDGTATFPFTFQTAFRFVRFTFISDSGAQQQGWDWWSI